MLNLRAEKTVEIEGVEGERYRFTFARFSAAGWQRYSLYRGVARRYAVEQSGFTDDQLDQVIERVTSGQDSPDSERIAFSIMMDAFAWSRITATLEKIESQAGNDSPWVVEETPSEWRTPDGFLSSVDRNTVLLLDNAAIDINRRLLGLAEESVDDKKKESENAASLPKLLTDSPNPSTITKTTASKRQKKS